MSLTANVNEKANLNWAIADKLTGVYKPHDYGEVILPMTVIRPAGGVPYGRFRHADCRRKVPDRS